MITWENTLIIIIFVYSVWRIVCENLWKWSPKWNTWSFYQILPTNSSRDVLWSVWRICLWILMKWSLKWNTLICYQILSTKECTVVTLENLYVNIVTWRVKDSKKSYNWMRSWKNAVSNFCHILLTFLEWLGK